MDAIVDPSGTTSRRLGAWKLPFDPHPFKKPGCITVGLTANERSLDGSKLGAAPCSAARHRPRFGQDRTSTLSGLTMATPTGIAVATRQAASGYALRALPRRKTYTTSWDINPSVAKSRQYPPRIPPCAATWIDL
jgi:hypothetical protein